MKTAPTIEAETKLAAFVDQHCICLNCIHVTATHPGSLVTCHHPEESLINGIPHSASSTCEGHDFADFLLAAELQALQDDWFTKAEADGEFDLPPLN